MAFLAGQRLTADALNEEFARRRKVYQTADQSVLNSTTFLSSNDLVLSVEANTAYSVDLYFVTEANTTADFKYNILLPSGSVVVKHSRWGGTASDTTVTAAINRQSGDVTTYDLSGVGFGTLVTSKPTAIIVTAGTAGNCTIQFAQNTANNTNPAVLRAGSTLELIKLSA